MTSPTDPKQEHAPRREWRPAAEERRREHGHTGEGAASALAELISQGEKRRREADESREGLSSRG